ncbi:hypothetical protein [Sphingosinicella sp.]|uniref:hypothetical protein n=1 Tax=Sphingosinicella sp. TaxID=1917971 RepID=UPI00403763DA
MNELDAMKTIAEKLDKLSADELQRVLAWVGAKYGSGAPAIGSSPPAPASKPATAAPPTKSSAKKTSKKSKSIISMDKTLNLSPSGKKSAVQFATEKKPSNSRQKCVVAAYYLREFVENDKVSVSSIYTFFKTLGWPLPADLKNMLSQAGTAGWLDTSDFEDIKITPIGENLIEHDLPAAKA